MNKDMAQMYYDRVENSLRHYQVVRDGGDHGHQQLVFLMGSLKDFSEALSDDLGDEDAKELWGLAWKRVDEQIDVVSPHFYQKYIGGCVPVEIGVLDDSNPNYTRQALILHGSNKNTSDYERLELTITRHLKHRVNDKSIDASQYLTTVCIHNEQKAGYTTTPIDYKVDEETMVKHNPLMGIIGQTIRLIHNGGISLGGNNVQGFVNTFLRDIIVLQHAFGYIRHSQKLFDICTRQGKSRMGNWYFTEDGDIRILGYHGCMYELTLLFDKNDSTFDAGDIAHYRVEHHNSPHARRGEIAEVNYRR